MLQPIGEPLGYFIKTEGPLLPPSELNSPLKRKANTQTAIAATVKRTLFGEKRQKIVNNKNQVVCNFIDINQLPPRLEKQARVIEHSLNKSSLTSEKKRLIQEKMMQILGNQSRSEKNQLVELGILYYYLASKKSIPEDHEPSLFKIHLAAVELEVGNLRQMCKRNSAKDPNQLLPSGVTAYLLRTFVRTIFPPDGGFNLGGCYTIKALLNSRLTQFLTDEMRTQVLSVTECLISDSDFRHFFRDPFEVHPSMQHLICLDLKIPFSDESNFIYVRWGMLTALFSLLGQEQEGNCYAVAATLNLLSVGKSALLKLMVEILQTGHFSFRGKMIPILPLLETRRKYAPDFKLKMTLNQAQELTPFAVASFALNTSPAPKESIKELRRPLGEWMELEFPENTKAAKEFFLSHKLSFLQQAVLATIQFTSVNGIDERHERLGSRIQILTSMMVHIHASLMKRLAYSAVFNHPDFQAFKTDFFKHLCDTIFMVDYTHSDYTVKEGRVIFDFHSQGIQFNGNFADYKPFKATRRLFFLSNGEFKYIDKLSDFIQCCVHSLDTVSSLKQNSTVKLGRRLLKQHLLSPKFRENMAQQIAEHNWRHSHLDWKLYEESDSFFLIQKGGKSGLIAGLTALEGQFVTKNVIRRATIKDFFSALCLWSSTHLKEQLENDHNLDPKVFAAYPGHALNLTPTHFRSYWHSSDCTAELKERVIMPGLRQQEKLLSRHEMQRALSYVVGIDFAEDFINEYVEKDQMSIKSYQAKVKEQLDPTYHAQFDSALTTVLGEFDYDSLRTNLLDILNTLEVDLKLQEGIELLDYMDARKKAQFLLDSYSAAHLLHKTLIHCSKPIYIPVRTIEQAIRNCYDQPEFIELGNLNWVEGLSEQLLYSYLVLTFDLLNGSLVLVKRRAGVTKALSPEIVNGILTATRIFHTLHE